MYSGGQISRFYRDLLPPASGTRVSIFYTEHGGTRFVKNVICHRTTWCQIPKCYNLNTHCHENLTSHFLCSFPSKELLEKVIISRRMGAGGHVTYWEEINTHFTRCRWADIADITIHYKC
jgi:hypothetical protein